ncbi:MAG: sulfatase-like hydrolase/transferase [Candidatus Nealsonbacteria bacterium]|nr:sulfatase-like hydrolase/transferase [Candidatus Nealsonbacteria bacterium]
MKPLDRRQSRFLAAVLGAMSTLLPWHVAAEEPPAKQPNIVLIMADDLGYECLGCNGGTSYKTPNLDVLARDGMRLEHCYSMPVCSPSRIKIMSGRYNFRNYLGWGLLDPKLRTFGHVLRDAGYATCVSGKWQLCQFDEPEFADHPYRSGFDESCVWVWHFRKGKPSRYWDPLIWQQRKLREDLKGKYGPDVHCDFLIDFIERNKSRPFFAYYPINLVHAPFTPTPDSKPADGSSKSKGQDRNFADMVAYMDKCVGRVVAALDRLGLRENTLILFTGDNGTPRGITSKMGDVTVPGGKGSTADNGIHVPLLANWPGHVPAGKTCDDPIDFADFMPTLAEAAGATLPEGVKIDGRSFYPQILGREGDPRGWVFLSTGNSKQDQTKQDRSKQGGLVRDRRWKLYSNGRLFDTRLDPLEKQPISPRDASDEAKAARGRLQAALDSIP